uniref:cytochrome c oxidase subunit II n=1 Tax=Chortoglyphus arcuatus TaxID=66564 RepID=UPI0022060139|nr:cytochrome c oxidase subunit II [Chortoglyphus arcuatus]UBQ34120.1 cytochrome c oxidase subunit II [Chortoglyphus arcuatus]
MPSWLGLNFQDSCSFSSGELFFLHDHVMVIMFMVVILITYIMFYLLVNLKFYKFLSEGTLIETIWSMVPAFLLVILVFPSMSTLYIMEDYKFPSLTFKVVAHQWYWSYVVPLFKSLNFSLKGLGDFSFYEYDSMMEEFSDSEGFPRLLGCSSDFFMPVGVSSRLLITSTDVIHSFSLPSMSLKVDALPGRINQLFVNPSRVGLFFGQCSEICGSNHSFMPISVVVCSLSDFDSLGKSYLMDLMEDSLGGVDCSL